MKLIAKPFVKWAGGKSQILDEIRSKYPTELGKSITKYAEPFVGGGAVLFDILNNYKLEAVYISDINPCLIKTYLSIRNNVESLISLLTDMQAEYWSLDETSRKPYYYNMRDRFNLFTDKLDNDIEIAALFIFLNRTCFNGLYRVNSKGKFNVPMGNYKKPTICDNDNLHAISSLLKNVEIICGDYRLSDKFIDNNTFAYFDPPYRPLSATSSFTAYASDNFKDNEQTELAHFVDALSQRGASILVSNSDPKNTNANDNFFDTLYSKHSISRISAKRMINSSSSGRGKISELLIGGN